MANVQKTLAQVVGVVLTVVGLLGFFMGSPLFGFTLNPLHNVVHLLTGLIGLYAGFSKGGEYSMAYNKWLGVVYLLVAVLGFVVPTLMVSMLNGNSADNFLHLLLGLVLAGVGFGAKQ